MLQSLCALNCMYALTCNPGNREFGIMCHSQWTLPAWQSVLGYSPSVVDATDPIPSQNLPFEGVCPDIGLKANRNALI